MDPLICFLSSASLLGFCFRIRHRASPEEAFSASLYQMELDRLRYSLSKYLRTRLRKVERDALHVLACSEEEMQERLSDRCFLECTSATIECKNEITVDVIDARQE